MNTDTIRHLTETLDMLRAQLFEVNRIIGQLEATDNYQGQAVISICGASFAVGSFGSTNVIRLEAVRLKKLEAASLSSRINGVEWKIRQAAKGHS